MTPERHEFHPSRPGGTVCVAWRELPEYVDTAAPAEQCGYPASHPIHGHYEVDLSPRAAPLRTDADKLRGQLLALADHARRTSPGDALLAARIDEMVQRWGSAR